MRALRLTLKWSLMLDAMVDVPHPEIWAFGRLLESIGRDGRAPSALGLAGGAGFLGMGFRYARGDVSTLHVSGWNPFQSDLPGAAKRLGVIGTLDETSRRRRAAKSLEVALAAGTPFALWLDTAAAGLAPSSLLNASPGVVIASAASGGEVELTDGTATVRVDVPTVAQARAVHAAQRYRLLALRPASDDDLVVAARGGLARMAVGPTGGEQSDRGPAGVEQLGDAIDGTGPGSWREVFEGDRHLLGALVSLHQAITREQGLLRAPQAVFERDAAGLLELPALGEVAEAHDALAAGWLAVAERALPADVPGLAAARTLRPATDLVDGDAELPLTSAEQDELLADLGSAVRALAPAEHEALELLRETLRAS